MQLNTGAFLYQAIVPFRQDSFGDLIQQNDQK